MIVYLTFTETAPGVFTVPTIAYTPTWVHYPGTIIRPTTPEGVPASYGRTAGFVSMLGFDGPAIFDPAELR
jgi:hypothetical protein